MKHHNRGLSKPLIWTALAIFLVLGLVVYWSKRPGPDPVNQLSATEAARLVRLAEKANACLENESFRDGFRLAEESYLELKKILPDDLLAYRNLVVLRILQFSSNEELRDDSQFLAETDQWIQELIQKDPDSFESYLLAVRWRSVVHGELDKTDVDLLKEACQRANGSPVPHYEFFDRTIGIDERLVPGIEKSRRGQLAKAYALQPANLKLALAYLQQLAEAEDVAFVDAWSAFQENLGPVVAGADLEEFSTDHKRYLSLVDLGVKARDWPKTLLNLRFLANKIKKGEVQKIDLARIQPHELEFLLPSLSSDVVAKAGSRTARAGSPPPVRMTPGALVFSSERVAKAVRALDFDLDEQVEVAVLYADSLEIFDLQKTGHWKSVLSFELKTPFDDFVVADLDYDNTSLSGPIAQGEVADGKTSRNYADPDFVLYGPSGLLVLENRFDPRDGRQLLATTSDEFSQVKNVTAAILADIDHDKDLDLVLGTENGVLLFLSRGNLSFFDYSEFSVLPTSKSNSLDIVDIDRDIDIDIVVGQESSPSGYLENLGHGRFRFREFEHDMAQYETLDYLKIAEIDGNRSWDFVGFAGDSEAVLATTETTPSSLTARTDLVFSSELNHKLLFQDFNNDGFSDVLFFGTETFMMLGDGKSITRNPARLPPSVLDCDYWDFDDDGLLDLVAISGDGRKVEILKNTTDTENRWLKVYLCGINSNFPKGRVNNHAIGTFVESMVGSRYFATTVTRPWVHVGLGETAEVDLMRILWTSGMPQSLLKAEAGQVVYEEMFEKGSCPYIYTWNGSGFTFFGDCLWGAPLGLQSAPGKFIPCRNWEYLKIPGESLLPRDGQYVIQITEELREAAYFDLVELYAIDHPADVDIFTNEKVGPPFIAQHKIHCVQNPRLPVAAKDMYGNNVLAEISECDQVYFKGFKTRIAKGLAPMHYIELDLGDLKAEMASRETPGNLTLFLHGWIRPTDCSLNISFAQNPDEPSPVPPVILVPDKKGEWQTTVDPMGFPGGKPKTIAVELNNAFLTDDYRVRIQTSHEIYWDQIFFTLGENEANYRASKLPLASADLHYRGFSRRFVPGENSPELYDYSAVTRFPRWPAMAGSFTRFGDVKELLTAKDDCFSVIGAGDEMTLAFEAPNSPPAGWTRDYVIHLVGYDKDADLNTVTGQSVEPLPFDQMKGYPYGADQDFPSTEKHLSYLRKYQTRKQSRWSFWDNVVPTDPP